MPKGKLKSPRYNEKTWHNNATKKQLASTNRFRRLNGMEEIEIVKRQCLNCDKIFDAVGRFIRMCDRCKNILS